MKYLVTGGAGFIGSHLVDRLLADGHIKEKGDILVVTITQDEFVNKGPGRPVFNHKDSRYYIGNPIMLFMANIIIAFKLILLGKKSEFD